MWRGLTIVSLGIIAYFHLRRQPVWDAIAARAIVPLTWLPAFLASASLFLLSWHAAVVRERWPETLIDDPHDIAQSDMLYQITHRITDEVMKLAGVSVVLWFALMLSVAVRGRLTGRQLFLLNLVWLLSWTLFGIEPTHRFAWWLD